MLERRQVCAEGGGWGRRGVESDRQSHSVKGKPIFYGLDTRQAGREGDARSRGTLAGPT